MAAKAVLLHITWASRRHCRSDQALINQEFQSYIGHLTVAFFVSPQPSERINSNKRGLNVRSINRHRRSSRRRPAGFSPVRRLYSCFATGLSRRCIAPVVPLKYRRVHLIYSILTYYMKVAVIRNWLMSCVENLLSRYKLTCLQ